MKYRSTLSSVVILSLLSIPAFAQESGTANTEQPAAESAAPAKKQRGPVDFEKFSRLDDLKAADTDGDGTLSREEIEALALKRIVSRAADRMERRLDMNGDGKVTLEEIENQRRKEFAALDRNEDGKIDRREMRAARMAHHGKERGHRAHHMGHHKGGSPMKGQSEKPQE